MNIWIYIITGIILIDLLTLINRETRNKWKYFLYEAPNRIYENFEEKRGINKFAYLFYSLLMYPIMLVFLLLIAPVATIDIIFRKKRKYQPVKETDTNLYFVRMGGAGTIICSDCGYKRGITSFIHGIDSCTVGYQCQSCGIFHCLDDVFNSPPPCTCGGELSSDKPLFCPRCKSKNMNYECKIIT